MTVTIRCLTGLLVSSLAFATWRAEAQRPATDGVLVTRIGGDDGSMLRFSSLASLRLGTDGRVVLVDPLDRSIVGLGPTGAVEWRLRATGRGPREVASIRDACGSPSNAMLVLDPAGARVGVVASSGKIDSTRAITAGQWMAIACARRTGNATALVRMEPPVADPDASRLPAGVRAMRATGRVVIQPSVGAPSVDVRLAHLADFLVMEGGAMPRPLGAWTSIGVADDGHIVVVRGDSALVQWFDQSGREIARAPLSPRTGRLPDQELKAARTAVLDQLPTTVRDAVETRLADIAPPAYPPTHVAMAIDDRGQVWVQRARYPQTEIDVFAPTGKPLRSLTFEPGLRLLDAQGGLAAFAGYDADGAVDVRIFRVKGPAR